MCRTHLLKHIICEKGIAINQMLDGAHRQIFYCAHCTLKPIQTKPVYCYLRAHTNCIFIVGVELDFFVALCANTP